MFSPKVAGIEIVGDEVRVAVVRAGSRLPAVLEMASRSAEYDEPEGRGEALAAALDAVLDDLKHRPAAFVLCVNAASCVARTLTIPFRGARRVAAAVRFELEPYLAFPIEDLLVDFKVVAEIDGETEVLAMGLRRDHLEEQLAVLEAAGVHAEGVTMDAVALTGLWQAGRKKQKGLQAVLHVREEGLVLAITYRGGLAYFRTLPVSAAQLTESPVAAARDLQNSIRAFLARWRGEGEIAELHLTGLALDDAQRQALSEALRLPVKDETMAARLKGAAAAEMPLGNRWEAGIGAAATASGGAYSLDFRRGEQDWRGAAQGVVTHLMFSACLALLVLVGWAFYYFHGATRLEEEAVRLEGRVSELTTEIEAIQAKGLGEGIDAEAFRTPFLLDILSDMAATMPEDKVTIREIKMMPPDGRSYWLQIQGSVNDGAMFREVFSALQASTIFRVEDDPDLSSSGGVTTFTIKAYKFEGEADETAT